MKRIKNRRRLLLALNQYQAMQARRNALEQRIDSLRQAVVAWYEHNNSTQIEDEEGYVWRKQQGSSVFYDDKLLKRLLKKHDIPVDEVYHVTKVEERDEEAIAKLLREKKLSVKEWKRTATIHYHKPYVRRFAPAKNNDRGKTTESD